MSSWRTFPTAETAVQLAKLARPRDASFCSRWYQKAFFLQPGASWIRDCIGRSAP